MNNLMTGYMRMNSIKDTTQPGTINKIYDFDNLIYWLEFDDKKTNYKAFCLLKEYIKRKPSAKTALKERLFAHSVFKNTNSIPLFEKLSELVIAP